MLLETSEPSPREKESVPISTLFDEPIQFLALQQETAEQLPELSPFLTCSVMWNFVTAHEIEQL